MWVWAAAAMATLFLVGLCLTVGVIGLGIRSFSGSFANPFANSDGEVVGEVRRIDLPGTTPEVTALAFLPGGKRILGKQELDLCLWDLTTGKERSRVQFLRDAFHIAISPDGRYALVSGSGRGLGLWDVDKAKELRTFGDDSTTTAFFTPSGEQAWSLDQDTEAPVQGDGKVNVTFTGCTFRLWSVRDGRALRTFQGPSSGAWAAAFSQNCRRAVLWFVPLQAGPGNAESRLSGSPLQVWDLDKGQELGGLDGPMAGLCAATISPDGQRLLTAADDGKVCIWSLTTGRVQALAFSPDGRQALTGGEDKTLRLWDVETGREVHRFEGHTGEIVKVLFSPDGTHALSSAKDKTLRLWRLP
jgi:WD40 repeat protein